MCDLVATGRAHDTASAVFSLHSSYYCNEQRRAKQGASSESKAWCTLLQGMQTRGQGSGRSQSVRAQRPSKCADARTMPCRALAWPQKKYLPHFSRFMSNMTHPAFIPRHSSKALSAASAQATVQSFDMAHAVLSDWSTNAQHSTEHVQDTYRQRVKRGRCFQHSYNADFAESATATSTRRGGDKGLSRSKGCRGPFGN